MKKLRKSGIEPKSVTMGESVNIVVISDPDGNKVVFAQGKDEKHRATCNQHSDD